MESLLNNNLILLGASIGPFLPIILFAVALVVVATSLAMLSRMK